MSGVKWKREYRGLNVYSNAQHLDKRNKEFILNNLMSDLNAKLEFINLL